MMDKEEHSGHGQSQEIQIGDVGHEKLVETNDEEWKSAWKEHHGKAVMCRDGRFGTVWRCEDDDDDNHAEKRKRRPESS